MSNQKQVINNEYGKKSKIPYQRLKNENLDQEKKSILSHSHKLTQSLKDIKSITIEKCQQIRSFRYYDENKQHSFYNQKVNMQNFQKDKDQRNIFPQNSRYVDNIKKIKTLSETFGSKDSTLTQDTKVSQDQQIIEEMQKYNQLKSNLNPNQDDFSDCEQENQQQQIDQYNEEFVNINQIQNSTNDDKIKDILQNHKDYLKHASGQCVCYKCECNMMCKCGFNQLIVKYKQNLTSSYDAAFQKNLQKFKFFLLRQDNLKIEYKNIDNIRPLKQNICQDYYKTVKQNDFTKYNDIKANPRFRKQILIQRPIIDYLTSNKIDYQPKSSEIMAPHDSQKKRTTLKESKFYSSSTYKDYFQTPQIKDEKYDFFVCNKSTIPLKNNFSFIQKPSNQDQQKFQNRIKDNIIIKPSNNLECLKTIDSMFATTQQKAFQSLNVKACRQ